MPATPFLDHLAILPNPADKGRAADGRAAFIAAARDHGAAAGDFAVTLAGDTAGQRLLDSIFGNSPFLTHLMIREAAFACQALTGSPEPLFAQIVEGLASQVGPGAETPAVMAALRQAKRQVALLTALADISGLWDLVAVTRALSDFADAALDASLTHLLAQAAARNDLALSDPAAPAARSGYIIIGMGKLGARELNYSSDIDLMVLYDPDRLGYRGSRSPQEFCVRLTHQLVTLMEERTADGYVFRTDLRLRPDPRSTPPALSVLAAETYYESVGQNWERAAMIKARPVAGDREAGAEFLAILRPFVWRKHLDFAAIQDIHSIKRQIDAQRVGKDIAIAGRNIKLGGGGIREIEFFAQTQQLIWGGRDPRLRIPATCDAIRALCEAGHVDPAIRDDMIVAYDYLRRIEHRLQMIDDEQTQTLPTDPGKLERMAVFSGYADTPGFAAALVERLATVSRHYAALFGESPSLGSAGNLVFTGTEDDPETLGTLTRLGYKDAPGIAALVRGWHHSRIRATRSERARELLTAMMPALLAALAETADPDSAFKRFSDFLGRLPAGVQIFSLFNANPHLLELVAEIMGTTPRLAESMARRPQVLDAVLDPAFYTALADAAALENQLHADLRQARDFQDTLDIARRFVSDQSFRVGVQVIRRIADIDAAGRALSDLADATVRTLRGAVEREFIQVHGTFEGGGLAILGLGKLGSRELTIGSDLDLVLVYDVPAGTESSTGPKPLPPSLYFTRLGQRLISALTVPTGEGNLYQVDMRLRPSGNAGPVAPSLVGFVQYENASAWTWEHMALTRARVIDAPPDLRKRIEDAIRSVLTKARDPKTLAGDVADMRARIAREHRPASMWDVKYIDGGLIDTEFCAQYLMLRHAHDHPDILHHDTALAIEAIGARGLLPERTAKALAAANRQWRTIQGILRLTVEGHFKADEAPANLWATLARASGTADRTALERQILATAEAVANIFADLMKAAGTAWPPDPPSKEASP